jgi:hypothetical protein
MSDEVKCMECNAAFNSERGLHGHLKAHKMEMGDYYHKFFPRHDKFSGELIKFKDKGQYLVDDFNSKESMRQWIDSLPVEKAKEYCKHLLVSRKNKKGLVFSPTQVELRTILSPSIVTLNSLFGDYYKLCEEVGFTNRYQNPVIHPHFKTRAAQFGEKVYVDTREQDPLTFNLPWEIKSLKFGDYAFNNKEWTDNCYIERKSLSDFIGTLGRGVDRFKNEIERAAWDGAKLIVVVEESLSKVLEFRSLPEISDKVKVTPEFLFHNVREIIQTYANVQFLFVNGRKEAVRVIEKIFLSGNAYKSVDIQLLYDTKQL